MQIFVYMLRCSDGSYYVGLMRYGLDKRLGERQDGRYHSYIRSNLLNWSARRNLFG